MKKRVLKKGRFYVPTKDSKNESWISDEKIYGEAAKDPIKFWEKLAEEGISWKEKWKKGYEQKGEFFKWFLGGKLNICYNALDRHLYRLGDNKAIIWVPEKEDEKERIYTYKELWKEVNKFANVLKQKGIKKGDVVCIYLPLIPEVIISMLACARIGAIHSIVFSGFSSDALKVRVLDGEAKLLITADGYYRKGEKEKLLQRAEEGIKETKLKRTIVINRFDKKRALKKGQEWYDELLLKAGEYCEPETMESNEPLFILYTSGTTGKPKGVIHESGGYSVQAMYTTKWNFNLKEGEIIWCTADIGWVTGHTYLCYGPLLNGFTTLMYEGIPNYPNPGRFWKIINKYKVSAFYTAPTALRMFILWGDKWVPKKMDSLKILGSVGEPIDEVTWKWYFKKIGKGNLPVIDTWWQTETGTNVINSLPGVGPFMPGIAGRSLPGTKYGVVSETGRILKKGKGLLVQFPPFSPAMLRGVWKNEKKYKETYFKLNGKKVDYYITGDAAVLYPNGFIKILGRSDDVIKVAGHRLSTAELEHAIHKSKSIGDVAVVSRPDKIKGEEIVVFAMPKKKLESRKEERIRKEITSLVNTQIGPIARPKEIYFVEDLPKTRSGKIMRRILKSLLRDEELGELSTIVNKECIDEIKIKIKEGFKR
ncbi:acetate--CoA ligase [Patescibacteria group bacterium]|nr:acetate--CoA ligase [Patescibacteria group bacterium]